MPPKMHTCAQVLCTKMFTTATQTIMIDYGFTYYNIVWEDKWYTAIKTQKIFSHIPDFEKSNTIYSVFTKFQK